MRLVLNLIWLVFAGVWLAIAYLIAAAIMVIPIVTIPFAKQALKLAGYVLWPFGRVLIRSSSRSEALSAIGNVLWFVLAGWWLAIAHLLTGALQCLTIIGIPLGIANFKMAGAALFPFGKEIVSVKDVGRLPADAVAVPTRD